MRLFDAHCHLEEDTFDRDREEVLARAREAGLVGIVTSPIYPEDAEKALGLFGGHDLVKISIGLDVAEYGDEEEIERTIAIIEENSDRIVAVGEVGLDYRVAQSGGPDKERQKKVLRRFIRLAESLDKPLVIHSLWAQRPVLKILSEEEASRVVLHAFGGTPEDVRFAQERGWYVSIATNVVRSKNVRRVADAADPEFMVLESDSPVLAPNPKERNDPGNIRISVSFLAEIKGLSEQELAEITTRNALKVYDL